MDLKPSQKLIRKKRLRELVPYSDTTVWRMEKAGTFPQRVKLAEGDMGAVAWYEDEILNWLAGRVRGGSRAVRRSPVAATEKPEAEPPGGAA
jgi:prophage regulatory protein